MLPQLYPQAFYAEDQPSAHEILTIHVLHRGFNAGALAGSALPLLNASFARLFSRPPHASPLALRVATSAGTGSVIGTALLAVGLTARMWEREEVEWQDRSWRLLSNGGQNRTDDWSMMGAGFGALGGAVARMQNWQGFGRLWLMRAGLGGAAMGSALGVLGHVVTQQGKEVFRGGRKEILER
ncbi:MAG: hypothetical protein LQ351_004027 [Letrouitia transgressa]|nr:MAG: hypothetical protein LQ351_004027 [Letrouitia transgressa]